MTDNATDSATDSATDMLVDAVTRAVRENPIPDRWLPGEWADDTMSDQAERLEAAMCRIGWSATVADEAGVNSVALAAVPLGRGLASLRFVDAMLGGRPVVAGLVRHWHSSEPALELAPGDGLRQLEDPGIEPAAYGDGSGIGVLVGVCAARDLDPLVAARRIEAWRAASIGYLAGLSEVAFTDCLEHLKSRTAFGSPLAAREAVQGRLADCATALEGIRLLAASDHSWASLCYSADAAVGITSDCHQLMGALGFTLDYPLQRRSRRARAVRAWSDWAADAAA
jgi:hypothetical protein